MDRSVDRRPGGSIGSTTTAVWFTATASVTEETLLLDYEKLLDDNERQRYASFRFPDDQKLYLVAHALLRTSLSRYSRVVPQDWRFTGKDGERPEIAESPQIDSQLRFNLSHTSGLAACIVAEGVDVGIDVESLDRQVDAMAISDRFFAPYETQQLAELSGSARRTRFLQYWTLKEAYLKACGLGLSIPLDSFHFRQNRNAVWQIEFPSTVESPTNTWQFLCVRPTQNHVMSIAIHDPDVHPFDIRICETVPLCEPTDPPSCHSDNS